jgi:hypothetical protein
MDVSRVLAEGLKKLQNLAQNAILAMRSFAEKGRRFQPGGVTPKLPTSSGSPALAPRCLARVTQWTQTTHWRAGMPLDFLQRLP